MNDLSLALLLLLLAFAFASGPAALVWCAVLSHQKRELERKLSGLVASAAPAPHAAEPPVAAPTPTPTPTPWPGGPFVAPEPSSSVEADVSARRQVMRSALERITSSDGAAPSAVASATPEPEAPAISPSSRDGEPPPPPPSPPSPPEPLEVPPLPDARIGWEQLLGVRGAAALGAVVLVLAGLYFFRFSVEHGLLTPPLRVALGTLGGIACLSASETVLRRRFAPLANWMAGAGVALLYAAFWAAAARYGLVPMSVGALLMVLVTATSVTLSIRRRSLPVALLGLLGGFATPLLLSTGSDRPVALFSYLLLLDLALLGVAHARRWPALALMSLLGTVLYQGLWIGERMGPTRLGLGIAVLLVFALVFGVAARVRSGSSERLWRATRAIALAAPFVFALYFGLRAELAPSFVLPGAYLGLLVLGAAWFSARSDSTLVARAAVAAGLGSLGAWLVTHSPTPERAREVLAVTLVVSLLLALIGARSRRGDVVAASIFSLGSVALTWAWSFSQDAGLPLWLLGWSAHAAILLGLSRAERREELEFVALAALGAAASSALWIEAAFRPDGASRVSWLVALALGVLVTGYSVAPPLGSRRLGAKGAIVFFALLALGLGVLPGDLGLTLAERLGGALILGFGMAITALRAESAPALLGSIALTALVETRWILHGSDTRADALVSLAFACASTVALLVWTLLLPARQREQRFTWRAAALTGPAFFFAARHAYVSAFGNDGVALLALAFGSLSFLAALFVRRHAPNDASVRRVAWVWLCAAALSFVSLAVPLELENEWITIGWALEAVALLTLWRKFDHVGLKYAALALLTAVSVRLVANPWVLEYHARAPIPLANWLSYTYLVPAFSCFIAARWLGALEAPRLRRLEQEWLPAQLVPLGARAAAGFGILIVFVWLNLGVIDVFSTRTMLELDFTREPARDLVLSLVWASYALVLLAAGVARRSTGLRAASLALLIATSFKVFLYDLAHLGDLYRVASLVGLAVTLISVSLAYQRFVFRSRPWRLHATS